MEICNQLLQGIDEQGRSSGLIDRVVQQEGKPNSLPPFLSTFPRQNLTAIKISFKTHGLAVFSLNKVSLRLIGYSSGPQSPKGSQEVAMSYTSLIWLKIALWELQPRAVAILRYGAKYTYSSRAYICPSLVNRSRYRESLFVYHWNINFFIRKFLKLPSYTYILSLYMYKY